MLKIGANHNFIVLRGRAATYHFSPTSLRPHKNLKKN